MSNLIEHAKREFLKLGYLPIEECDDDPNKWVQKNVLELLEVFSKQGHSGSSAPYTINMFKKLAAFEPIAPILCTDDEWFNYRDEPDESYQNIRCSSIFKKNKNGEPYYLDAIIWRNQHNCTYSGSAYNSKKEKIFSRQYIKLPFQPKSFYIDIIEYEIAPDDWEFQIKDDSQLKEVWQYYKHQETPSYIRYKKLKYLNSL